MLEELSTAQKVVGVKQSLRALREGRARKVFLACAAVFIPYFILSSPSGLCRYHIIVDIRFLLRKIFTQNLSVSCIMRTAG